MAQSFANADAVLKEDYKGPIREQINQKFFILSQIEKKTDDITGRRGVVPLHVTRNSGVGARKENGTLPTAGQQGYVDALIPVRWNYGRIQLSGPIIRSMQKDRGAFTKAVKSETKGVVTDLSRDINRQLWGTADGVIATCGTTTTSATIQLLATATFDSKIRQLWADGGMFVDIGTVANPVAIATNRQVTAFDRVNKTITISGATVSTVSGTHFVFRTGNGGGPGTTGTQADSQVEMTGLQFIVAAAGSLHTVSPATYPTWKAQQGAAPYNNGGTLRNVSENLVNQAIMDTEIASGEQIKFLVGSPGVARAAAALMASMRRNNDTVALKAGWSGIQWSTPMEGMGDGGPKALLWDRDCPESSLFGLAPDSLVELQESDWEWMEEDGAVLSRVSGTDAYEATLFKYAELCCTQRDANFRLEDLAEG